MTISKKVGVSGAFLFTALVLFSSIESRYSLAISQIPSDDSKHSISQEHAISQKFELNELGSNSLSPEQIKKIVEERLPGIEINDIEPSPMDGFYQAFYSGELLYISQDGRFIFTGKMLELAESGPVDHSQYALYQQDLKQQPLRAKNLAEIKESDMVVFKAENEKHIISVFTDVDCAYCRKLHKEVPQMNANGITVRYLAFPRAGIGSDAFNKLASVWCADDKLLAMNDAKLKRQFGKHSADSCRQPIISQYHLTRKLNLSGTPAIILSDGELIAGYVPADELVSHLNSKK